MFRRSNRPFVFTVSLLSVQKELITSGIRNSSQHEKPEFGFGNLTQNFRDRRNINVFCFLRNKNVILNTKADKPAWIYAERQQQFSSGFISGSVKNSLRFSVSCSCRSLTIDNPFNSIQEHSWANILGQFQNNLNQKKMDNRQNPLDSLHLISDCALKQLTPPFIGKYRKESLFLSNRTFTVCWSLLGDFRLE